MNEDILYIVIPAYNESENIESVIEEWYPVVERHNGGGLSRLVVIDDGSLDDTFDIVCRYAGMRSLLLPLTKPNSGHGPTLIYGYKYALNAGADCIFQTDSDGQTSPEEFEEFWDLKNEYDVVLGSRPAREDGISRAFVEAVVCLLLRLYFGVKVSDANAPYRLMKARVLKRYIPMLPEDYAIPNIMLTAFFVYYGESVAFRDIRFKPRRGGRNSLNIKGIVKAGWEALGDFCTFRKEMRSHRP